MIRLALALLFVLFTASTSSAAKVDIGHFFITSNLDTNTISPAEDTLVFHGELSYQGAAFAREDTYSYIVEAKPGWHVGPIEFTEQHIGDANIWLSEIHFPFTKRYEGVILLGELSVNPETALSAYSATLHIIPVIAEPATVALVGLGLLGLVALAAALAQEIRHDEAPRPRPAVRRAHHHRNAIVLAFMSSRCIRSDDPRLAR